MPSYCEVYFYNYRFRRGEEVVRTDLKKPLMDGLTIGMGYVPVAVAFGITAKPVMSFFDAVLMSFMVYGGASQFLALQMMSTSGAIAIVFAVFILNSRHFVMSFKVNYDLKHESFLKRLFLSSYVTDEGFAVTANSTPEQRHFSSYAVTFLTAYLFWVTFSAIGYLAGEWMSEGWVAASGIALYALFIALLIPAARIHYRFGIIAMAGMIIHYIMGQLSFVPSGIAIVLAILIAAALGSILERAEVSR